MAGRPCETVTPLIAVNVIAVNAVRRSGRRRPSQAWENCNTVPEAK
jgi:hypothetical protein